MSYRITATEDSEGRTILKYHGDAQALVDACAKEARGSRERGKFSRSPSHMRKIMSVDPVVLMDIAQKNGLNYYDPAVFELLKDRDYSKFRTSEDRLLFKARKR